MISGSGRFAPLVLGPRELSRILVSFSEGRAALSDALVREIADLWQREAGAGKRGLFDGRLAGLAGWYDDGQVLRLELVPVRYRELWYVHVLAGTKPVPPPAVIPRALGVSAVVMRGEEIVLMLRTRSVGEWPEKLDVFGGHIDWPPKGMPVRPEEAALAELREELGDAGREAALECCVGLAEVVRTRKPEIVFLARLSPDVPLSLEQTNDEVERLTRVPVTDLGTFLEKRWEELTPSAEASLWLFAASLNR